jgi:hypothetical protein
MTSERILTPEFLTKNAEENFEMVKNWSKIYKSWNDVQKSNEECKGAIWAAIKYLRINYPTNSATYSVQFKGNEFIVYGWIRYSVVALYHYTKSKI